VKRDRTSGFLFPEMAPYTMREIGDAAEVERLSQVATDGNLVVPLRSMTDSVPGTQAPMLFDSRHIYRSADILVLGRYSRFEEVKAKSKPGWHGKMNRWEQGIDLECFRDYRAAEKAGGIPWIIVLRELRSPVDPTCRSKLIGPGMWLFAPLKPLWLHGHHVLDWPSKDDRGKGGKGGWLWPRSAMARLTEEAIRDVLDSCRS
jgi:hypothetical protein